MNTSRRLNPNPVICVGGAFWDTIFLIDALPARPTKVLPQRAVQVGAGMAPAAACTIARFGGRAELWARVGADAVGDDFCRDVAREGVGTAGIRRCPGARTSFASILVDRQGERLVVPYVDPSLDPDPGWLDLGAIASATAVFADCRWPEGAAVALAAARTLGVPTLLDADVAPATVLEALVPLADHVLFSETALLSMTRAQTPAAALMECAARFAPTVAAVTLGAQGAMVWSQMAADRVDVVPTIAVTAVDTLSAGDTWHGAYLFGFQHGWTLRETVVTANVAAAMKCEQFGGRLGTPTLDAVRTRLVQHGLPMPGDTTDGPRSYGRHS